MLNILFLSHRLPFPPDRGDRIRSYQIVRHLAQRHRISVGAVVDELPDEAHLQALRTFCASVDTGYVNRLGRRIVAACYLPTTVPLTIPMFFSRTLKSAIARRMRSEKFDLIFIYCSAMAPYALPYPAVPKAVDFIDADSQKWFDYARTAPLPLKSLYWREGVLLRRYERRVAKACGHAFAASEREAEVLRKIEPGASITTITNGVTVVEPDPSRAGSPRIVFTGVMDYWPNVDAVQFFAREILPIIRERVPAATFMIVGQRPTRQVNQLARLSGVTVTGQVADVRPYLESGAVFVAPLRMARGVQNKVLEAMGAGLPVVCTSAALGGLDARAGLDILVADTAEEFALKVASVLLSREQARTLSRSATEFVRRHHQWDVQLERMESALVDVARRQANHGSE